MSDNNPYSPDDNEGIPNIEDVEVMCDIFGFTIEYADDGEAVIHTGVINPDKIKR